MAVIGTEDTLLRFSCHHCGSELNVPSSLAGVTGPCPACRRTIQAPLPVVLQPIPRLSPKTPPPQEHAREEMGDIERDFEPGRFQARRAIPKPEEPLDDSWEANYKQNLKRWQRKKRMGKRLSALVESRFFRVARVLFTAGAAAIMFWLAYYMKTHRWRTPWEDQPPPEKDVPAKSAPSKLESARRSASRTASADEGKNAPLTLDATASTGR